MIRHTDEIKNGRSKEYLQMAFNYIDSIFKEDAVWSEKPNPSIFICWLVAIGECLNNDDIKAISERFAEKANLNKKTETINTEKTV